jgi:formylmethanofuran dehydrogenase subunit C
VDARAIQPGLALADATRQPLPVGNTVIEAGELFAIEGDGNDGHIRFEGDLRSVRGIGQGLSAGAIEVRGDAGGLLGAEMTGGSIDVEGNVADWAGAEMRGGFLRIKGQAGDSLGGAFPGSRLGMREGVILVEGSIGDGAGSVMRRGLIAVSGRAGDDLGRSMIAGSIVVAGATGNRLGAGMKRGTVVVLGSPADRPTALLPTFVPSGRYRPPFLALYLARLRDWGFPVPAPAFSASLERYNGDLAERGQGEIWLGL